MENRSNRGMHWAFALLIAFAVRIAVMVISEIAIAALGISRYPKDAVNGVWAQFAFDLIANAVWIALTWKRYAACKAWSIYNIGWRGLIKLALPGMVLWGLHSGRLNSLEYSGSEKTLMTQVVLQVVMILIMVVASHISRCNCEDLDSNEAWLKAEQEKDAARQIEKQD